MTTERKIPSFKDFQVQNSVTEAADAILPVLHDPDAPEQDDDDGDDSNLPRLFATIHYKSEHRPDGYTSKQLWELNNAANAHLPHLQQPWPHGDNEEAPEEDENEQK